MPLRIRDTFFMANTGGAANPVGSHLMICIANTPEGMAIIVPIVSRHAYSDTSCVLDVGDHPFIRHESRVSYDFIRAIPITGIDTDVTTGKVVMQAPISPALLVRIQIGLLSSDEVEPWAYAAAHGDVLRKFLKKRGHI